MIDAIDVTSPRRGQSGLARACKWTALATWVVGANGLIAYLMALHETPLPPSSAGSRSVSRESVRSGWRAIHVLAGGCPCSAAVADSLAERGPAPGVDETVYVSGDSSEGLERLLEARGFHVTRVTPDLLLSSLEVRGAPWLVVIDPRGRVAYSGGYAPERPRAGVVLRDQSIIRALRAGEWVAPLPAFGCAIDPSLERAMDPLGLK